MKYITRLKTSSLYNDLIKKYHFVLICIINLLIIYNCIFKKEIFNLIISILLLIIILILLYIYQKNIFIFTVIIILTISVNFFIRTYIYNHTKFKTEDIYQIIKIESLERTNKILLKTKNTKYYIYTKDKLEVGMKIYIKGSLQKKSLLHTPNGFNYQDYLFKNNIKGIIEIEDYQVINKQFTIYNIHDEVNNYFDKKYKLETNSFLKALLIGNKNDLDEKLMTNISSIGIGHLFVISGLHMNIIVLILSKILNLFKIKEEKQFPIIFVFLIIYYVLTLFMISIIRIIITNVLRYLNDKLLLHLSNIDIYAINIMLVLLFNPFKIFSYSFILTYLISTTIVIINPILTKKSFIDSLIISLMSVLVTLPVIININPSINLLSILYNIIYIPFVSYILLPFSIILVFFPFLELIYLFIVKCFTIVTNFLGNINVCRITIPHINILTVIIYFMIIIKLLLDLEIKKMKKTLIDIIILITFMIIISNKFIFNNQDQIYFLDLPVGESTLIIKKFNQANILIDTGEKGSDELITFLQKKGIKKIDILIITHGDSDHCGMLDEVMKNFKVKKIILSQYDDSSKDIYDKYNKKAIFLQRGDYFKIKKISFKILWPYRKYDSSNNNSLVILINFNNFKILMTGDIEKEAEKELIDLEKIINVDLLKIAHHGSKTSTSDYFLQSINFNNAIIMSGYNNTFGFPSGITLNKLKNKNILCTSELGSINIKFSNVSQKTIISTSVKN